MDERRLFDDLEVLWPARETAIPAPDATGRPPRHLNPDCGRAVVWSGGVDLCDVCYPRRPAAEALWRSQQAAF